MGKRFLPGLGAVAVFLFFTFLSSVAPGNIRDRGFCREAFFLGTPCAYAAEDYPYGGSPGGSYGEKQQVKTKADAKRLLKKYFSGRNVTIGEIREKEYYFEADILDSKGKVVDKVIVDKRSGRIRSIY